MFLKKNGTINYKDEHTIMSPQKYKLKKITSRSNQYIYCTFEKNLNGLVKQQIRHNWKRN